MAIAVLLAPTLGRQAATTIVLGFFNQWVAAVGHADDDMDRNYYFAMGTVGWDDDKRRRRSGDERHHRANYVGLPATLAP